MLSSLSAVVAPPKDTNSIVCLYTWPAALLVNDTYVTEAGHANWFHVVG